MQIDVIKNTPLIILVLFIAITINDAINNPTVSYTTGAPSGHTGSPGDGRSCARSLCHVGNVTFRPDLITSDVGTKGYFSDSIYRLVVAINEPGISKFGFQISPQDLNGNLMGTLKLVELSRTQILNGNKYLTHKIAGTPGNDSASWTFDWIPPLPGAGEVTFYAAVNATNNNNASSGDKIFTSTLTIFEADSNFTANPAPDNTTFNITFDAENREIILSNSLLEGERKFKLFSLSGKLVMNESIIILLKSKQYLPVPFYIDHGIYIALLENNDGSIISKKIFLS